MTAIPHHILMLHNRYQYPGGEDASTQAEIEVLRSAGHQVTYLEENNNRLQNLTPLDKLQLFLNSPWNPQQYHNLRSQLQDLKPDILHVQNFFPLFSPSVHSAAKSLGIPTIQHLRNFRLGCLNSYLYREQQVCEACVGHNPWRGVVYRCYRQSLPESLALWHLITYNRGRKTWSRDVDGFIAPSHFAAQKLLEIGIPSERLYIKPNFTSDPLINQSIPPLPARPTFLYLGRLSPEKGVITLLQAWKHLHQREWQLNLLGDGPQRQTLEAFVQEHQLLNVTFYGQQPLAQVIEAIKQATAVVVPSQWYETFGRVVIDAFACGRGALVSNLGALSELVQEGKTGLLIAPQQIEAWSSGLNWCGNNPWQLTQIGQNARQTYLEKYTPEVNYQQIIRIYQGIISSP
jgi:glycosyltransferase involved in cell wall biosynthesis